MMSSATEVRRHGTTEAVALLIAGSRLTMKATFLTVPQGHAISIHPNRLTNGGLTIPLRGGFLALTLRRHPRYEVHALAQGFGFISGGLALFSDDGGGLGGAGSLCRGLFLHPLGACSHLKLDTLPDRTHLGRGGTGGGGLGGPGLTGGTGFTGQTITDCSRLVAFGLPVAALPEPMQKRLIPGRFTLPLGFEAALEGVEIGRGALVGRRSFSLVRCCRLGLLRSRE